MKTWLIYIEDYTRFWLYDIIVSDFSENPAFGTERKYAMRMRDFEVAMKWRERLVRLGYAPHIISDI